MLSRISKLLILGCFLVTVGCADQGGSNAAPQNLGEDTAVLTETTPQVESSAARDLLYSEDKRITYCEIKNADLNSYSRTGSDTELYPIASLSKMMTSLWALSVWGADRQFTTTVYLQPISGRPSVFDVHLTTQGDPIFNREKVLLLIAQLHQRGVRRVRHLTIDRSSRIYLSALNNPSADLIEIPVSTIDTVDNLKLMFNSDQWATQTQLALRKLSIWADQYGLVFNENMSMAVDSVSVAEPSNEVLQAFPQKFYFVSSSLKHYLKNLNVYSNNYLADTLFKSLGGAGAFEKFQTQNLKIPTEQMILHTGSGISVQKNQMRSDNRATCYAVLRVVVALRSFLDKKKIPYEHVLLNPDQDLDGTFVQGDQLDQTVYLKTGRLFEVPAMNVAGWSVVSKGFVQFVFLAHDFDSSAATLLEQKRLRMLQDIGVAHGVRRVTTPSLDYHILVDPLAFKKNKQNIP